VTEGKTKVVYVCQNIRKILKSREKCVKHKNKIFGVTCHLHEKCLKEKQKKQ
jgi:hypothetical protein